MSDQPLVALVVPVHNGKEDTREFLASLAKLTYPNYKLIIIDDGSTDGTGEMVRQERPETTILKGDGNLWSSGALNLGIEKAMAMGADYVLLVDNDTVVDPEFVSAMVKTAEQNPRAMVVPKVYQYYDPRRLEKALYGTRRFGYCCIGKGELDTGQYDSPAEVPWSDTMTLINTAFFKDVGLFDAKDLPMYGADMDFSLRAHKKGYRTVYEPKSMIWHKSHSTAKKGRPKRNSLWARVVYFTTNVKSPVHWHTHKTFILRHSPFYLVLPRLMLYFRALVLEIMASD